MKLNLFCLTLCTAFFSHLLPAQSWQSAKRYSAAFGSVGLDNRAVAAASDGSIYMAGTLNGTANFDNVTLSTPVNTSQGYLLKLDADFQAVWGATFPYFIQDVTTDVAGNVFVVGSQRFNNADSLTYVAKYDSDGQLLATFLSTATGGQSLATAVCTDAEGNCYVGGRMLGPVTMGSHTLFFDGGWDCYLMKLSPDLAQVNWAALTGSTAVNDALDDLAVDNAGNIYTSGRTAHTTYCCGFLCLFTCHSGNYFIDKHSAANGNIQHHQVFTNGGYGGSAPLSIAVDATGESVFTAANFVGSTTISQGTSLTATGVDLFITRMKAGDLSIQWAKNISEGGAVYPQGLKWAGGSLYVHGSISDTVQIGNITLNAIDQDFDPFVAQINAANGTVLSATSFIGSNKDYGYGIDVKGNKLVVSGNTTSPALTVGDFNLSGTSKSFYVAQKPLPASLSLQIISTVPVFCHGEHNGSAGLTVSGGTAPYSYAWSSGAAGAVAGNLAAGNYTVTVTDNTGFQATASVTITEPPAIQIQTTDLQHVSCAGLNDGQITVAATGGTPPLIISGAMAHLAAQQHT